MHRTRREAKLDADAAMHQAPLARSQSPSEDARQSKPGFVTV
jgi:hypothetical protein